MSRVTPLVAAGIAAVIFNLPAFGLEAPFKGVSYQGELRQDGVPFAGPAKFRFMILNGTTEMLWSHDGTGSSSTPPSSTVELLVENGVFSVLLGGAPMLAITPDVFSQADDPVLRVWVDGPGPEEQLPDQPIRGSAYAHNSFAARWAWGSFTAEGQVWSKTGGFKFPDGTVQTTASSGSGGNGANTLDKAYDEGGPGAGRFITADAGEVRIEGSDGLHVGGHVGFGTDPDTFAQLSVAQLSGTALEIHGKFFSTRSNGFQHAFLDTLGRLQLGNAYDPISASELALRAYGNPSPTVRLEGATGTIEGALVQVDTVHTNELQIRNASDQIAGLITAPHLDLGSAASSLDGRITLRDDAGNPNVLLYGSTGSMFLKKAGNAWAELRESDRRFFIENTAGQTTIELDAQNARVTTGELEITGGADLAEPFEVSGEEDLPPGTVLVIDESHPGRLRCSGRSYDSRVAGAISGAGGVSAGITLRQEGVLDQGRNVALSGRVWVRAEASSAPIRAGDLLTTSSMAGHAMCASDRERRAGAVLGKAMTALDSGTGLVLVLVTLQ